MTQTSTDRVAHTPGPWTACDDGNCRCAMVWGGDGNTLVALAGPGSLQGSADAVPTVAAAMSNAALIAAAPELLKALKEVVAVADRKTVEFDGAHAAIAKAEGRQP